MAPAFKEWAVVVHALLEGEQVLDVRKGGLHEDGRHFSLHSTRLWLYPTVEHQAPELLKAPYRHWIDLATASPAGQPVRIEGWADVVRVGQVTEQHELDAIASKLIWTPEYVASRFGWKPRDPLWVLGLRVHRLLEPIVLPWDDAYGGCTSWFEAAALPDDPASRPSEPALSDVAFASRLQGCVEALPSLVEPASF